MYTPWSMGKSADDTVCIRFPTHRDIHYARSAKKQDRRRTLIATACAALALTTVSAWADDAPAPCVATSFTYYTPPMPTGTVQRTPGQLDVQLPAVAGANTNASTASSSLAPQDAALQFTTQLLETDAETETSTWAVHRFYDDFCETNKAKVDPAAGRWLPNTCGIAYQYDVINPGRPNIGVLQQALRQDVRLMGVCAMSNTLDTHDTSAHSDLKSWLVLGLGLNEVLREGFNVGLVDPKVNLAKTTAGKTNTGPISGSEGNQLPGNEGLSTNPSPTFDVKLSLLFQVMHQTPGLRDACRDDLKNAADAYANLHMFEDAVTQAQQALDHANKDNRQALQEILDKATQERDTTRNANGFDRLSCNLYLGSIIWDVHECDEEWKDANKNVADKQEAETNAETDLAEIEKELGNATTPSELVAAQNAVKNARANLITAKDDLKAATEALKNQPDDTPGTLCYGHNYTFPTDTDEAGDRRDRGLVFVSDNATIDTDCGSANDSPLMRFIFGTISADLKVAPADAAYTGVEQCRELTIHLGSLLTLGKDDSRSLAALYKEAGTALQQYLDKARNAYIAGDFASDDMADEMVTMTRALVCLESSDGRTVAKASSGGCQFDPGNQNILSDYRRLVMIHEVIQASNGHNYQKALSVLTRATCVGTVTDKNTLKDLPGYDMGKGQASDADDEDAPKPSLGTDTCRLLYVAQDVIQAQTSADLQTAVQDFASTTGSWRYKSASPDWIAGIGGILGIDVERDNLNLATGHKTVTSWNIIGPVGVEFTHRLNCTNGFAGVMINLIDVGQLIRTGGSTTSKGAQVTTNTGVGFGQVWSPGVLGYASIGSSPFVVGFGVTHVPQLRIAQFPDGTTTTIGGYRVMLYFGVDTTLLPL